MRPTDYIASLFKPSGGPGGESAAYDFDPIGSYFYNCPAEEGVFQIVDAETTADLDLNAVFEKIDRTTSRVGQQYLYARLRTLRGEEDAADFDRRVGAFENDDELTQRCAGHLARLAGDDAYDLCRLIFDTPVRVRRIGLIYALTAAAAAALLLAPFYPALLLLFMALYAVNMYIHYSNKINISLYTSAVKQLSTALKTARHLAAEGVPGSDEAARPIRRVAEVEHRSRIVGTQGDGGNELAAVGWLAFELVKIAFNIEVRLFHRFTGSIATHRDAIHDVFRFIGRTDAAISVMRLRRAAKTCRPTFTDGKYLEAVQVVHPLIEGCTANTLTLDGTGLDAVRALVAGRTTLVAGNSGVGKSTLVGALEPGLALRTGSISESHRKGRHTTTFSAMYPLTGGGFLIDTPGIKGFGLIDIDDHELWHYFPEMMRIGAGCRVYNCTHTHEPGCAVTEAVKAGEIAWPRYESYLKIRDEDEKYRK